MANYTFSDRLSVKKNVFERNYIFKKTFSKYSCTNEIFKNMSNKCYINII